LRDQCDDRDDRDHCRKVPVSMVLYLLHNYLLCAI
jgi:hypothetical protein